LEEKSEGNNLVVSRILFVIGDQNNNNNNIGFDFGKIVGLFILALTFSQQVVIASIRNNKVCFDFDIED
jgi:hypothetical protein